MPGTWKKKNGIQTPGLVLLASCLLLGVFCLDAFCPDVWGGQFSASPSFSMQEQFNDNIFLTDKDRKTDYITRLIPSMALDYDAPLWKWDLAYSLDYRHFLDNSVNDNFAQNVNLQNSTQLMKKFFYIDASDTYAKTSLSLTRNYNRVSLFLNQTDQNIFTMKPHFTFRPGRTATIDAGYAYQNIWYKNALAVKKSGNSFYAEAKDELSPSLEVSAGGIYSSDLNNIQNYDEINFHAGSRYWYSHGSDLFFAFGNDSFHFDQSGGSDEWSWDAGIDHRLAAFSARLEASSQAVENPSGLPDKVDTYSASLSSNSARTPFSLSLSMAEYRDLASKELRDRTYGLTGAVSHKFTRAFTGSANLTAERIEDKVAGSHTNLIISGLGFNYQLSRGTYLSLNYQYTYSHSPLITYDRYLDDQVTAGITVDLGSRGPLAGKPGTAWQ